MNQTSKSGKVTLLTVGDLHTLKYIDEVEGPEIMMLDTNQLIELRDFLNSLELPDKANEATD